MCCVYSTCILTTRVATAFVLMGRGHVRVATVCEHNNPNGRDVISHASARARATNETRRSPTRTRARAIFWHRGGCSCLWGVCVPEGLPHGVLRAPFDVRTGSRARVGGGGRFGFDGRRAATPWRGVARRRGTASRGLWGVRRVCWRLEERACRRATFARLGLGWDGGLRAARPAGALPRAGAARRRRRRAPGGWRLRRGSIPLPPPPPPPSGGGWPRYETWRVRVRARRRSRARAWYGRARRFLSPPKCSRPTSDGTARTRRSA